MEKIKQPSKKKTINGYLLFENLPRWIFECESCEPIADFLSRDGEVNRLYFMKPSQTYEISEIPYQNVDRILLKRLEECPVFYSNLFYFNGKK